MLDIKEELKNYKEVNVKVDSEVNEEKDNEELGDLLMVFTKAYERIGKEQYKTSNAVDEILEILEENSESNKDKEVIIKELKEQVLDRNNELKAMLNTIVAMADIFDYMNNYVSNSDNENLKEQFKLVEEQLTEKLAKASITVLGIVNGEVDVNINQPLEAKWEKDKPEGIVLGVIEKGYMYKGKLLRKAKVIVNKNEDNN